MERIIALIHSGFKRAAERAVRLLYRLKPKSLLLNLPEGFTAYTREYMNGNLSLHELWKSYEYLTGFKRPYINALKYQMEPIVSALCSLKKSLSLEVHCYLDLQSIIEQNKLTEKLLLLEVAERVRSEIKVEEWRRLLFEEYNCSLKGWRLAMENLTEWLRLNEDNIILYNGFTKPLRTYMKKEGFELKPLYLQHYWRPPLEALRTLIWMKKTADIQDDVIVKGVENQLKYLDHILSSNTIDEAHKIWTREVYGPRL